MTSDNDGRLDPNQHAEMEELIRRAEIILEALKILTNRYSEYKFSLEDTDILPILVPLFNNMKQE